MMRRWLDGIAPARSAGTSATGAVALTFAAVTLLFAWGPGRAAACEPMPCLEGYVVPSSGTLPASFGKILWAPTRDLAGGPEADRSAVHLFRSNGAREEGVPVSFEDGPDGATFIRPTGGFVVGASYRLEAPQTCIAGSSRTLHASFTVTANAPPPRTLGTMRADFGRGALTVATASGSCATSVEAAWADVTLAPSPEAAPFRDVLLYETLVDGTPFHASASLGTIAPPGSSWVGRGIDRIFTRCHTDNPAAFVGLTAGTHRVSMRARLPGDSVVIESGPVTVELSCTAPPPSPIATPIPPAPTPPRTPAEARGPESPAARSDQDSGGLCAAAPGARSPPAWCLAAIAGALGLVRRRV